MKSGNRTLTWDSPLPGSTQRKHLSPNRGDSIAALRDCANDRVGADGIRAVDFNFQCVRVDAKTFVPVSMHWTTPGPNGYTDVALPGGGLRRMTAKEKRKHIDNWGLTGVLSWRRPNGDRPLTYDEAVSKAAELGVVICAELKSTRFAYRTVAQSMVESAKAAGHPAWFMALLKMSNARGKCEAIEGAGGQFALIFGKFRSMAKRPPADWKQWSHHPTRIWGPSSARAWLKIPAAGPPTPTPVPPPRPTTPEVPVATSQNGYIANKRDLIETITIPGTSRQVALRKGAPGKLLAEFASWFDKNIESVDGGQLDDWGYAERPIRGSTTTLSNHASGTALDINAPRHPLGRRHTFSSTNEAKIRAELRFYEGAIRWGGDYKNRADEMHFEINTDVAGCERVLKKVTSSPATPEEPHMNAVEEGRALIGQALVKLDSARLKNKPRPAVRTMAAAIRLALKVGPKS